MNSSSNPSSRSAPNILVVDDSTDSRFLVEIILEDAGYQIQSAENGYSALARVEESPPDLMVLDLMMPGINGYEVMQVLRYDDRFPYIPVLIMTACHRLEWLEEANVEADALIHKPIDVDELLDRVKMLLKKMTAEDGDREKERQSPTDLPDSFNPEHPKKK
ncbi:MAG: response regulator [Limnospira sp.]